MVQVSSVVKQSNGCIRWLGGSMATGIDIFLMLLVVIHSLVRLANAGTGRAIICFYELLRVIISHYWVRCLEEHLCFYPDPKLWAEIK